MKPMTTQPKVLILVIGLLVLALVGIIDCLFDPSFTLVLFYLIPLTLVAWFVGDVAGIFVALACAMVWSLHDLLISHSVQHPLVPYWNIGVSFCFFVFVGYILSKLKQSYSKERELATTDYLTNVANRRLFYEVACLEINRIRRYKHPFSLVYLDIDNFKVVNDRMGHSTGDGLLRTIAQTIKESTRDIDLTARLGGDEFAILFPETDYEGTERAIQRIRKNIEAVAENNGWPITISIGAVTCTDPPHSIDELLKAADTLMYKAKDSGKNFIAHELWENTV
jgi:diguanylate cyclase (GGDEF)-like protein